MYTGELACVNTNHMHARILLSGDHMDQTKMPATIRLSNAEQEAIRQKCIEINKLLVKRGQTPMRDSELVHKILEKSVGCAQVDAEGEVVLEGC